MFTPASPIRRATSPIVPGRSSTSTTSTSRSPLVAAAGGLAAMVHLLAADTARQALRFTFPGVPDRPGEALAILADNARIAATILLVAALRGLPAAEARHSPLYTLAAGCCDAIVVLVYLTNVARRRRRTRRLRRPHGRGAAPPRAGRARRVRAPARALPASAPPPDHPAGGRRDGDGVSDAASGGCDRRDVRLTAFCRRMGVGEPGRLSASAA